MTIKKLSGMVLNVYIIISFSSLFLFQSCTSTRVLNQAEIEELRPNQDDTVWFVLKDGRVIFAESYHHITISEPSDFIFVIGEEHNVRGNSSREMSAQISVSEFDSLLAVPKMRDGSTDSELVYWISDSTYIQFNQTNAYHITPKDGVGYWCLGRVEDRNEKINYAGMIPFDEIEEINVDYFSLTKTIIGATLGGAVFLFFVVMALATNGLGSPW